MKFNEQLNAYVARVGCSAKALSAASGLSDAAISRYRSGEREPGPEQLDRLAAGIASLALDAGLPELDRDTIRAALEAALAQSGAEFACVGVNLKRLLAVLNISLAELARALNFDASYISRICSGQRMPVHAESFTEQVSRFVVQRAAANGSLGVLAGLLGAEADAEAAPALLRGWLCTDHAEGGESISSFLRHLDDFDLGQYIRAIRFDEIRVPTAPFRLPTSHSYYGLSEMKQGELDFFKATVLAKSAEPVFMCSDMPMADMAEDMDFGKKWMFAIAVMLKKGLHLDIIHNIDRPFEEMMLGLESWIPIYMTGQVSPYYLRGGKSGVYCHLNYVSGAAALTGECIDGFHGDGKYHLSNNREEVAYQRRKANYLLKKAQPLMEIYRKESEALFHAFLRADAATPGARHGLYASLPLYTMPRAQFTSILRRSGTAEKESARLLAYYDAQCAGAAEILRSSAVTDEVPQLTREEFEAAPVALALSGAFPENELTYTYEEYCAHLQAAQAFAAAHPNYALLPTGKPAFRNIQILIREGAFVLVSKSSAPCIHFVIRHAKMLRAFENLSLPVVED